MQKWYHAASNQRHERHRSKFKVECNLVNNYLHHLISRTCHNYKGYKVFFWVCVQVLLHLLGTGFCQQVYSSQCVPKCLHIIKGKKDCFVSFIGSTLHQLEYLWYNIEKSLKITWVSLFSRGRVWGLYPKWSCYWCFIGSTGINEGRTWSMCTFHLENIRSWKRCNWGLREINTLYNTMDIWHKTDEKEKLGPIFNRASIDL